MSTAKQIKANGSNANLSTGPTTAEGKLAVADNATKHGLRARDTVLADEDGELFGDMQIELAFQLQPEGELETFLVKRIAAGIWRLQRLLRVEVALFDEPETFYFSEGEGLGARFRSQSRRGANVFSNLSRYEASIERGLFRTLHELRQFQAARRGEDVPLPAALGVPFSAGGSR